MKTAIVRNTDSVTVQRFEESKFRYSFTGHQRVLHNVSAELVLPDLLSFFSYDRVFIVCSKTLNTNTDVIAKLRACLGEKLVGVTDKVGEHSPLSNVIEAALSAVAVRADVIVSVGGGSVMDMCKAMQLCISESVYDREGLLKLQFKLSVDGTEMLTASTAKARIRQIAIPTTLATSEWTPVSTPVDNQTHLKARFLVPDGSPIAIIYDPSLLMQTPRDLVLSTGVRGLDHAINTVCSSRPHPFASLLAEKAVQLYVDNLPLILDGNEPTAFTNCQLATWYTGMGQMSVPHGFSHWMVHIVGPYGSVPHSDAGCVLMLAQAKWLDGWATEQHTKLAAALRRPDEAFHAILHDLLRRLKMPTSFEDLGLTQSQVNSMIEPGLAHPMVTKNNRRPIKTASDLKAILSLAFAKS